MTSLHPVYSAKILRMQHILDADGADRTTGLDALTISYSYTVRGACPAIGEATDTL